MAASCWNAEAVPMVIGLFLIGGCGGLLDEGSGEAGSFDFDLLRACYVVGMV
jgi:hypothetical protein